VNLATIADAHPADAVALVSRGQPTTFGELRRQVAAVRGGLQRLGVEPGDRVALACANNRYFVVAFLATLGAGAIAVPVNPSSPTAELEAELAAVEPVAVIVGPSGAAAVAGIDRVRVASLRHALHADDLDAMVDGEPGPVVDRDPDDIAVLIFTAGTAGAPKAAMLSHGNLHANIRQIQATPTRALSGDDVSFGVLPMFHIFGLNVVLGVSLFSGARVVLAERFDPVVGARLHPRPRHHRARRRATDVDVVGDAAGRRAGRVRDGPHRRVGCVAASRRDGAGRCASGSASTSRRATGSPRRRRR